MVHHNHKVNHDVFKILLQIPKDPKVVFVFVLGAAVSKRSEVLETRFNTFNRKPF